MDILTKIFDKLKGKKTYLMSVVITGYTLLQSFDILQTTTDQDIAVYAFLGALFGAAIRHSNQK